MKKWFKKLFRPLKSLCHLATKELEVKYSIISLNLKSQQIILSVKRSSLILKYEFSDIMNESWLIECLSTTDAALFGYFYGRSYRNNKINKNTRNSQPINSSLLSTHKMAKYKILYSDRKGNIAYFDNQTQQLFIENPSAILNNFYTITNFNPAQACYIGILAGSARNNSNISSFTRPSLKIIS